jgi:uncharacterized membrane protein YedE/YeeE
MRFCATGVEFFAIMNGSNFYYYALGIAMVLGQIAAIVSAFRTGRIAKEHAEKIIEKVATIETATNGMKTELVEATRALAFDLGRAKGHNDQIALKEPTP